MRTLPVTVVPSNSHDSPGGTKRSPGTVTAPPVPTQYVTRSAFAAGATDTTAPTARALAASAAMECLLIAALPCSVTDVGSGGRAHDAALGPVVENPARQQRIGH